MKAGRYEVEAAGAGVDRARAGFLPKVDVSEGFARSDNPVFAFSSKLNQGRFTASDFAVSTLNHPDPINNFRTAVTLSQPLFEGGKTVIAYDRAKLDHGATRHRLERREQEVIFQTARAYYEVVLAEAELEVVQAGLRAAEANRALARDRFGVGLVVESDVLSADVRLAGLKEQEIVAVNAVELAKAGLNEVMGRPLDEALEVTPQVVERSPTSEEPEDLGARALTKRPDYLGLGLEERARARGIDAARAELFPTVSATASYEVNNLEVVTKGQDSWFLGLVLRWNLFNGFGDQAGIAEARARLAETRAVRDGMSNRIRLEVKDAFLRLRAATGRIGVARSRRRPGRGLAPHRQGPLRCGTHHDREPPLDRGGAHGDPRAPDAGGVRPERRRCQARAGARHHREGVLPVTARRIAALLAIVAGLAGCSKHDETPVSTTPPAAARVAVKPVLSETVHDGVEAVGTVTSRRQTVLSAKVLATVTAVSRREGDRVRADEVLVELDDRDLRAGARARPGRRP